MITLAKTLIDVLLKSLVGLKLVIPFTVVLVGFFFILGIIINNKKTKEFLHIPYNLKLFREGKPL